MGPINETMCAARGGGDTWSLRGAVRHPLQVAGAATNDRQANYFWLIIWVELLHLRTLHVGGGDCVGLDGGMRDKGKSTTH
jgi:hypothetical protein